MIDKKFLARVEQNRRFLREFPWLWAIRAQWFLHLNLITGRNAAMSELMTFFYGDSSKLVNGWGDEVWAHYEDDGLTRTMRVLPKGNPGSTWLTAFTKDFRLLGLKHIAIIGEIRAENDEHFDDRGIQIWRLPLEARTFFENVDR